MTTQEQIEYLATKVLGWHVISGEWRNPVWEDANEHIIEGSWNPRTNWNHWRQIEEKVMEDEKLATAFCQAIVAEQWRNHESMTIDIERKGFLSRAMIIAMKADLPTNVSALISAHRILYGN